jgi:hypothetical protein
MPQAKNQSSFLKISANGEMRSGVAAGCWLLRRSNFDMTTTTHKLQVNKHTTMKIEVIVSFHFPPFTHGEMIKCRAIIVHKHTQTTHTH